MIKTYDRQEINLMTISGPAGSGKGTVAQQLQELFGYENISIGGIKRKLAKERNINIQEFNALGERPENRETFDLQYEEYQKKLNPTEKIILDGRLSFYCQPQAFKIFLDVDQYEGAKRIYEHKRDTDNYASEEEVLVINQKRNTGDAERYMKLYGVDIRDHRNFDFVFDTTYSNPTKTMKYVKEAFEQFTGKQLHYLPGMESRANEKTSGDEVISCLHELSAILDFSKKIDNESLDELTWLTTLDSKDDIQNLNTLIKETNVNKLSQLVELLRPDTIVQLAKLINRTDIDNLSILIAQTNPTDFAQLITCVDEDDLIYLISMSKPTQLWRLINKMDTKTLVSLIQRADTIVDFTNTINNCDIDQFVAYTI